jgi:hypothetical protein
MYQKFSTRFTLVVSLTCSSILKKEASHYSESQNEGRLSQEYTALYSRMLRSQHYENLKSKIENFSFYVTKGTLRPNRNKSLKNV